MPNRLGSSLNARWGRKGARLGLCLGVDELFFCVLQPGHDLGEEENDD